MLPVPATPISPLPTSSHWVLLMIVGGDAVTFTNTRRLKPIDRFREDLYLYSPKGAQYIADGLRALWRRWLADIEEGKEICRLWKKWVGNQVKKYEGDIAPDDADHPTIHGRAPSGTTRSTRSPTTSACRVRTSTNTCDSATR